MVHPVSRRPVLVKVFLMLLSLTAKWLADGYDDCPRSHNATKVCLSIELGQKLAKEWKLN